MSTFNNFAPGIMLANHFSIALKPFVFATRTMQSSGLKSIPS